MKPQAMRQRVPCEMGQMLQSSQHIIKVDKLVKA